MMLTYNCLYMISSIQHKDERTFFFYFGRTNNITGSSLPISENSYTRIHNEPTGRIPKKNIFFKQTNWKKVIHHDFN